MARQGGQRSREGAKLIGRWFANHGKVSRETEKGPCPAIAEQWNAFQRSTLNKAFSNRSPVRMPRQGWQTEIRKTWSHRLTCNQQDAGA